jgi:hypothetical protein
MQRTFGAATISTTDLAEDTLTMKPLSMVTCRRLNFWKSCEVFNVADRARRQAKAKTSFT